MNSPAVHPPSVDAARSETLFTIPNALSIVRALLTIPFVAVMLSDVPHARWWGVALLTVAALTDKLDGVLARRYHVVTEWGKILDPVADKIGMAVLAIVLVSLDMIPAWFLAAIIGRDVLILAGGLYVKRTRKIVVPSNVLGKWTVGVLAVAMGLALIGVTGRTLDIALAASVAMLVASLTSYTRTFVHLLKP